MGSERSGWDEIGELRKKVEEMGEELKEIKKMLKKIYETGKMTWGEVIDLNDELELGYESSVAGTEGELSEESGLESEVGEEERCQGTPSKPYPHHEVRQFCLCSRYSSIYSPTPTIYPLRQDVVIALLTKPSRRQDGTPP